MKTKLHLSFLCLGLMAAVFPAFHQAEAILGEPVKTVESDRKALSASPVTADVNANYTIHQFNVDGTSIREYVSPSGIVFGLAWNGLTHPDLTQLLGSYTTEYKEAQGRTPRRHGERRVQVKADHVVVEKWGHMRNLQGRAYVSDLIPTGVTTDEIK